MRSIRHIGRGLLLFVLLGSRTEAQPLGSVIDSLLANIELDSLTSYVGTLSGLRQIVVSDSVLVYSTDSLEKVSAKWYSDTLVTLDQRGELGNEVGAYWLQRKLYSFGYEQVVIQELEGSPWRQNVIAEKTGLEHPERVTILCAHYDAVPWAPGADDNASGTAAVLEAARILSAIDSKVTLLFALWDAEEIGLVGSRDFARAASDAGREIGAVVNLDMIGWDGDNDRTVEIHSSAGSSLLAQEVFSLVGDHGLNLHPVVYPNGARNSDHASFWNEDYPAVLLIEELYGNDFNPHYHSEDDRLEHFNTAFFVDVSRLATAAVANYALAGSSVDTESGIVPRSLPSSPHPTNWPNPFSGSTEIAFTTDQPGPIVITIFDQLGRQIDRLDLVASTTGRQTVEWSPDDALSEGVLNYRVESHSRVMNGRMVLVRRP